MAAPTAVIWVQAMTSDDDDDAGEYLQDGVSDRVLITWMQLCVNEVGRAAAPPPLVPLLCAHAWLQDGHAHTPLFIAAHKGHVEVVKALLEAGENKEAVSTVGDLCAPREESPGLASPTACTAACMHACDRPVRVVHGCVEVMWVHGLVPPLPLIAGNLSGAQMARSTR